MTPARSILIVSIALAAVASPAAAFAQNGRGRSSVTAPPRGTARSSASTQRGAPNALEERARQAFEEGIRYADELQWAQAAEAFERSYAILPRPSTLRNLGLAHRALGRYTLAIAELERFLQEGSPDAETRGEIEPLIGEMRAQLATITIHPSVPEAQVMLDERRVQAGEAITTDPGTHVVTVSANGYVRSAQTITLGRGENRQIDVRLERRGGGGGILAQWWFWTGVGVLAAGGVALGIVLGSREAEPDCGSLNICLTPR